MIKLYKDGDHMGIATDCEDEDEFVSQLSFVLSGMIDQEVFKGDWEFQLYRWLRQAADIVCKLRGHESSVGESRLLSVGEVGKVPLVASVDDHNVLTLTG